MNNPKTTLIGYFLMAICAAYVGMHVLQGNLSRSDLEGVAGIVAGVGFIQAKDGGH